MKNNEHSGEGASYAVVTRLRPEKKYAMDIIKAFPGGIDRKLLYEEAEKRYEDISMCHKVQAAIYRELQKRGDRGRDELFGNENDDSPEMSRFEQVDNDADLSELVSALLTMVSVEANDHADDEVYGFGDEDVERNRG